MSANCQATKHYDRLTHIRAQLEAMALPVAAFGGRMVDLGERTESEMRNLDALGGKTVPIFRSFDGTWIYVDWQVELTVNHVRFVATRKGKMTRGEWDARRRGE
jgi:hypothetical protein